MRTRSMKFAALLAAMVVVVQIGLGGPAWAAPARAASSAPQIIDAAGDANGLSTVRPYSNVQTPAVSQADADVTSVLWRVVKDKKKKVTGFTVQARLSAAPRAGGRDGSVVYRMLGTPACGAQFGVIYSTDPAVGEPKSAVRDSCIETGGLLNPWDRPPSGGVRDTAIPLPKIVGSTITWTVPLTAIPTEVNIVAGTKITDLRFGVYTMKNVANTGFEISLFSDAPDETYLPVLDDGRTKTAFSFT
jgi:hypothetical protein